MDLIFLITHWMNPSSYGLVILIQRIVETVHFMDLIIFWSSSWTNLSFYGLVSLIQRVVEPSTYGLVIVIQRVVEPVLLWTCNLNSMCG